MCGRYRLSRRKQIIAGHFDAVPSDDDWTPHYNIVPTQPPWPDTPALNRLETRIKMELSHVRMLRGVRANIEARTLVETANDLGRAAVELEDCLLQLIGEAQSAARRFPAPHLFRARNLAQQQALTPVFASAVGYWNELRALVRRLPEEMHALLRELQTFAREANLKLNGSGTIW